MRVDVLLKPLSLLVYLTLVACAPRAITPATQHIASQTSDEAWLPWPTRIATGVTRVTSLANPCAERRDGSVVCWTSQASSAQMAGVHVRYEQTVSRGPDSAWPTQADLVEPVTTRAVGPVLEIAWPEGPTPFEPETMVDGRPSGPATGSAPCALSGEREVTCWGPPWSRPDAERVSFVERPLSLAVSSEWMMLTCCWGGCRNDSSHACAVMENGQVRCWGGGSVGQLGDGARVPRRRPVPVEGITDARQLALGTHHSCALRGNGDVSCWGYNLQGQLGDGSSESVRTLPVEAVGVAGATSVHAGEYHSCALTRDGRAVCWGSHISRGIEDETDPLPAYLDLPGKRVVALSLGGRHTCALDESGDLWCGGYL